MHSHLLARLLAGRRPLGLLRWGLGLLITTQQLLDGWIWDYGGGRPSGPRELHGLAGRAAINGGNPSVMVPAIVLFCFA